MKILDQIKKHKFELRHLTVLLAILIAFQVILSFTHKASLQKLLEGTQEWYQKDSAERIANFTSTSFELLYETVKSSSNLSDDEVRKVTQAFDIIFSQQLLETNVKEICILVSKDNKVYAIDDGKVLLHYLNNDTNAIPPPQKPHTEAIQLYQKIKNKLLNKEEEQSISKNRNTLNIFVPFVPRGEYRGAVYMKDTPDFSFITKEIISNYDQTTVVYLSLILLGLLAMYYISSFTVMERDDTQKLLYEEHQKHLKEQIVHEKESLFTKRIYHTHHKAEKIMGFIKEDIRLLCEKNIEEIRYRVTKYSNFVSRVIYDMKWFDPPIHSIRGSIFNTDLNSVIKFIVQNIFQRISNAEDQYKFNLSLDKNIPSVDINEFVAWEIIEPLIQNSIEHSNVENLIINIQTLYNPLINQSKIIISDNGIGIRKDLLEINSSGIKRIFQENISTKAFEESNHGYGCYLAYIVAKLRCGWELDAENIPEGGCRFVITIQHTERTKDDLQ
ncbi:MAG: ATP-binding protein [Ignavibacteriaceae bacterium]